MSGDSYTGALVAAGATVHECKWFGDYQGHWIADVTLPDGRRGLILGYYGSCSGCDAFEAEFGYDATESPDYKERLAAFGLQYFESLKTPEEAAQDFLPADRYWSSYSEDVAQAEFVLSRLGDSPVGASLALAIEAAKRDA